MICHPKSHFTLTSSGQLSPLTTQKASIMFGLVENPWAFLLEYWVIKYMKLEKVEHPKRMCQPSQSDGIWFCFGLVESSLTGQIFVTHCSRPMCPLSKASLSPNSSFCPFFIPYPLPENCWKPNSSKGGKKWRGKKNSTLSCMHLHAWEMVPSDPKP